MKPYVICNMLAPLDGRVDPRHWTRPVEGGGDVWTQLYYRIEKAFDAQAYIVGRVTMAPFATGSAAPDAGHTAVRPTYRAAGASDRLAVVIDPKGRLHWESGDLDGDHLVMVLGPTVTDAHLGELVARGLSYIVMPHDPVDPAAVLEILGSAFGARKVLLEGGGVVNGAFMAAGVVDEVSIVLAPAIDGKTGRNTLFETSTGLADTLRLRFLSSTPCDAGVVHLRYKVEPA